MPKNRKEAMKLRDIHKINTLKNLINLSKKDHRKRRDNRRILAQKYVRNLVRKNFQQYGDVRKLVPQDTYYCYTYHNEDIKDPCLRAIGRLKRTICPFWYWIEIPEDERPDHIGIVAEGQTGIGGCKLLNETDDDMNGWGLLWDSCKECGISCHHKET